MAAPTRGGWAIQYASSSSTPPVVDLTSIPDGSWMIAVAFIGGNIQPAATPSGWRNPLLETSQLLGTRRLALAYKTKASTDTSLTWGTTASVGISLFVLWGGGAQADTATWGTGLIGVRNPANAVAGQSIQAGDSTHSVAPGATVAQADSLVISLLLEATTATGAFGITSGAATWFDSAEQAVWIEALSAGYTTPPVGTTGEVTATAVATQANNGAGVQIVLPPGAVTPPPTPLPGFRSVDQMLATPGATWAHRLGSSNWAEMSRNGAIQSAARGYGALEFSSQRSSDGWWFGMHDNNFDRTSQTTGSPAPNTLTQAQILSTYVNSYQAGGNPEAYWGLADFLDAYTPTQVAIVDPKNQLAHIPDFLNLLDAHGGNTKIVVKYSGVGTGSANLANQAKARGYERWGYFYEEDVANGNIELWQGNWSILGMSYTASQASWDFIRSFGKPVVAHIAPNQAAYNTGVAKGARMVQVSGVANVAAVGVSTSRQPWAGMHVGAGLASGVYVGTQKVWP